MRQEWLDAAHECFRRAGFVEYSFVEIKNEYCPPHLDGSECSICSQLPWLFVHTGLGTFKVGWRKRVISLEWSNTIVNRSAESLFPAENTTRWETGIHAWGYNKLEEYLTILRKLL